MSLQDPIADALTRMRNAARAHLGSATLRNSRIVRAILSVFKEQGYINGFEVQEDSRYLTVHMKYNLDGSSVIRTLQRVSKSSCRVYSGFRKLMSVMGGFGVAVISTPKGVMTDRQARAQKVGGEVLCLIS